MLNFSCLLIFVTLLSHNTYSVIQHLSIPTLISWQHPRNESTAIILELKKFSNSNQPGLKRLNWYKPRKNSSRSCSLHCRHIKRLLGNLSDSHFHLAARPRWNSKTFEVILPHINAISTFVEQLYKAAVATLPGVSLWDLKVVTIAACGRFPNGLYKKLIPFWLHKRGIKDIP